MLTMAWLPRHPVMTRFIAVGLLILLGWLQFSTLSVTSPTMDEGLHIVRGYAFVARGDERLRLRGPILSNALSGIALRLEPQLQLPPDDDPLWLDTEAAGLSEQFLWSNTAPPQRIVFLSRLPVLFAGMLLGAFVFRWACERSGAVPALGALILYVFCPNLLAHARLATTDVITSAALLIAAYAYSHALDRPGRVSRWLSGVAFGLALAAKFSSVALGAAALIQSAVYVWNARRDPRTRMAPIVTAGVTFGVGALTLWAIYRFKIGPLNPGEIPLPTPLYWAEWQALFTYVDSDKLLPVYLFGQVSPGGWWYYFPIAFLVKTPLPVLALTLPTFARAIFTRDWPRGLLLWLTPALLLGFLLFSPQQIGYRYLLPLLPFIFVGSAEILAALSRRRWAQVGIGLLLVWQVWGTWKIYPYYLAFFNELAGGPDRGRYILSDSNIDWGQDLIGLKHYVDRQGIDRIKLSYFGITPPSLYGMRVEALPPVRSALHDQGAWWLYTYYPYDPAPGIYAISVANLMGGIWIDSSAFAYFRDRRPDTTIGHSIDIYTVPARGAPIDLSLSGLQLPQIDPETYARFGTNDVRPRWFDATTSLIAPPGQSWLALADSRPLAPEFAALFAGAALEAYARLTDEDRSYRLYAFDLGTQLLEAAARSEQTADQVRLPARFGNAADLIGFTLAEAPKPSQGMILITYWRAGEQPVAPLQLFAHAIGAGGHILAQDDRLDALAYGWRPGDVIAQISRLDLTQASDLPPAYSIEIGLYHPGSGERLPVSAGGREINHRLLLKHIVVR